MPDDPTREPIDYLSSYKHGVDDKRRVQLPSKWRPDPSEDDYKIRLMLWRRPAPHPPCLIGFPPEKWRMVRQKISETKMGDAQGDQMRAWVSNFSDVATLDSAGRFSLPQTLAEKLSITKQVVLEGMVDYFRVWRPEDFDLIQPAETANSTDSSVLFSSI